MVLLAKRKETRRDLGEISQILGWKAIDELAGRGPAVQSLILCQPSKVPRNTGSNPAGWPEVASHHPIVRNSA